MLQYLVFLGAPAQLAGDLGYIRDTLLNQTKPNRVTWLMWAAAPIIGSVAAYIDGAGWAALPVFMSGFGPLLIFIASFKNKKSFWKLTLFDYLCGVFSLLALILWAITKEATIAIAFAMTSDFFAAIPTLSKAWKYPETESHWSFLGGIFGALTGLFTIKSWVFSSFAFIIYILIMDSLFAFLINRKKITKLFKSKTQN